jgi:hypothetical protein
MRPGPTRAVEPMEKKKEYIKEGNVGGWAALKLG